MKIDRFLKEVRQEMSKVVWPTRREVMKLTLTVIAVAALVSLFVTALDYFFSRLVRILVRGSLSVFCYVWC